MAGGPSPGAVPVLGGALPLQHSLASPAAQVYGLASVCSVLKHLCLPWPRVSCGWMATGEPLPPAQPSAGW